MKKVLLATFVLMAVNITNALAQPGIIDPNDAVVNYDQANPPATPPANTIAKWVRTPNPRITWNTDKFKAYYYNDMVFRIRFPNGYNAADATKKYPVIVFFHGGGEVGPITDNEIQLLNAAQKFEQKIDSAQFNCFMIFPQIPALGWDYFHMIRINAIMDELEKNNHADPDRVISMGLSAGGFGAMSYTVGFPQRVATTIAASPALIGIIPKNPTGFVEVPFWISSGGSDQNPTPKDAQDFVDSFTIKGGKVRLDFYPLDFHNTWDDQYSVPYLVPTWIGAHKANPLVYFNRTKFMSAAVITAELAISPGFFQYQWQKDNIDIPGATSNEYFPKQFGTYRVRFKRLNNSEWSDYSPTPVVISQDNIAPTAPLNLKALYTGRTSVNLDWNDATDNDSVTHYDIYVNGVKKYTTLESAITADSLLPSTAYTFTVKALDQAGNASDFSNQVVATTTAATNGLNYRYYHGQWDTLPNFNALTPIKTGLSPNADISVRPPADADNFGFVWEGYINIKTAGTYTFETNSDDGSKIYFNSFYSTVKHAQVNNDGLHGPSSHVGTVTVTTPGLYPIAITFFQRASGQTMEMFWSGPNFARSAIPDSVFTSSEPPPADIVPPVDPTNLKVINTGSSFVDLDWDNSTDNVGVTGYDIYVNNVKKYSSTSSNISATGLTPNTTYSFAVKALDLANNASGFSNAVSATTTNTPSSGLRYRYYEGDFNLLPDFNALTPLKKGTTPNIDLSVRTDGVNDYFAFIWEGIINITTPGTYTFETISDDGSKFYFNTTYSVDGTALVNNDGPHAPTSVTGSVNIPTAGVYPIAITFFEKEWGETMQLYWTGPGISRQLIPNSAFIEPVTGDNIAPTIPANLKVINTGNTFVTLDWDNSTDNVSVTGYDIYVNNIKKYTSVASSITADKLDPNTAYTFTVKAIDQSNNASDFSNAVPVTTVAILSGLKYRYYEGDWSVLPNFNTLTPIKSGSSPNVDIITPRNRGDLYGFVWEGYINIPVGGTYTFETISDDGSKFYWNTFYNPAATALVDNDGLHGPASVSATVAIPDAGLYPISMTFFENTGGESMQVYWSGPGIPRQLIPNVAFTNPAADLVAPSIPANLKVLYNGRSFVNLDWDDATDNVGVTSYDVYVNGTKKYTTNESAITADKLLSNTAYNFTVKAVDLAGNASAESAPVSSTTQTTVTELNYRYYEGTWDALPNFNALTPVKSGTTANIDISIRTKGRDDNFAFVWEGYINLPATGSYTFELVSDDGSKLYFNSFYSPTATALINDDGLHAPTTVSASVDITVAGLYPISAVYFEKGGGEIMQLYISGPGVPRQLITNSAFINNSPITPVLNGAVSTNSATAMGISDVSDKVKLLKAYPNPMVEWLNIDFYVQSQKSDIGVDMFDINGKMVYRNNFKGLPAGNNTIRMNVSNSKLAPGVYFVKVNENGLPSDVIKLVKSRQ